MSDLITLPLRALAEAPYNPRKHFDAARLQELADSIKSTGLHQPILVRPLPAARVPDTGRHVTHEIVAGARRFRAAQLAGADSIAAICRPMDDDTAMEVALLENLQRDDLSALEEAEGYRLLMQHSHVNADQVAAKIGKSRSYVYGRLKLLDLAPEPRQALADGRLDASRALLIARIPDTQLQAQACERIADDEYGRGLSARAALGMVQRQYMLKLDSAPFNPQDATLCPEAGACQTCPKRTGANPDLFADVKGADICTDPPCYRRKEQAHQDNQVRSARESGATVITGREARALMPSAWSRRVEGHLRLDDADDSPTDEPLRKLIGQQMDEQGIVPTIVCNPHRDGEPIAVLPVEQVTQLLHAVGKRGAADEVANDAQHDAKLRADRARDEARKKLEQAWRHEVLRAIVQHTQALTADSPALATPAVNALAHMAANREADRLSSPAAQLLVKWLDLGPVAPKQGVRDWVREHRDPVRALAVLLAAADSEYQPWLPTDGKPHNHQLLEVARHMGMDAATIEREARANALASARAERAAARKKTPPADAAQASPPLAPAAQASGVGGAAAKRPAARATAMREGHAPKKRTRLSAEEAKRGIAAAMQSDEAQALLHAPADADAPCANAAPEFSPGQQVRVRADLRAYGKSTWRGQTVTLIERVASDDSSAAPQWQVQRQTGRVGATRTERKTFHASELEPA